LGEKVDKICYYNTTKMRIAY